MSEKSKQIVRNQFYSACSAIDPGSTKRPLVHVCYLVRGNVDQSVVVGGIMTFRLGRTFPLTKRSFMCELYDWLALVGRLPLMSLSQT
jgi:hypothetical protein